MITNRFSWILAGSILALSLIACNLPDALYGTAVAFTPAAYEPTPQPTKHPCLNTLYPVTMGATWEYAIHGAVEDTYTRSIIDVLDDSFTDQGVFASGMTRTSEWQCEAGNLTTLFPDAGPIGLIQGYNLAGSFHTTRVTGITLPVRFQTGESWHQEFIIEGQKTVDHKSHAAKIEMTISCTAGPNETITVTAGTFDGARVGCSISSTTTVTMAGGDLQTNASSSTTMWYASSVGLIKMESEVSDSGHSTIELTSYTIP